MLHDPKMPFRFQPDGESGPCYLLRVPTVADRGRFKHALLMADRPVQSWSGMEILNALEAGVNEVLTHPDDAEKRDTLLAQITDYRERFKQFALACSNGEVDQSDEEAFLAQAREAMDVPPEIEEAVRILRPHVPQLKSMLADNATYHEDSGLVAAKMFLMGWEGIDAPFRRTAAGVPEEILAPIPVAHLTRIGIQIKQLLEPPQAKMGNFSLESGSHPGPTPSNGTGMPLPSDPSLTTIGVAQSLESTPSESTP